MVGGRAFRLRVVRAVLMARGPRDGTVRVIVCCVPGVCVLTSLATIILVSYGGDVSMQSE